ncbi:hypothetical protein ABW20_dc0100950 [Dactylellina cionopaga]|nr:hypothetical protein ABW20_dc0100950 [Dactylellina cionopaga]
MADPHVFVTQGSTTSISLSQWALGYNSPSFTATVSKGTITVSGTSGSYKAPSDQGIDYMTLSIKDADGSTWTRKIGIAIFTPGSIIANPSSTTTASKTTTAATTTSSFKMTTPAATTTVSKTTTTFITTTTLNTTTPPPSNTSGQAQWSQCGGSGWTGPTACVSTFTCSSMNPWYYQCL